MDGVPGLSFSGIHPGQTHRYQFTVKQSGTYWYHSHSGFQEQQGVYGPLVIEPREPDPVALAQDLCSPLEGVGCIRWSSRGRSSGAGP